MLYPQQELYRPNVPYHQPNTNPYGPPTTAAWSVAPQPSDFVAISAVIFYFIFILFYIEFRCLILGPCLDVTVLCKPQL